MDDQTLIQHDEYFPSGELWRDETDSRYELARRHTFTGKELDIGTGLYYFGARYYDGHTSQWLSPDPILGRYLEGAINRGVYSPKNLGLYTFAWNNPTTRIDSNGLFVDEARQAVEVTTKVLAPGVPVVLAEPTPAGEIILAGAFAVAVVGAFIYYEVSGSDSPKPSTPAPAPPSGVTPAAPAPPPAAAPPPPAPAAEAGGGGAKEPPKPPPPVTTAPDPGPGKRSHLNSNNAKSRFGIYEIKVNGQLYKIGKADLGRVTQSSGLPTRLHQQLRALREALPNQRVTGEVVENLGEVTTAEARAAETARLRAEYARTGRVPEGNAKSFKP